MRKKDKALAVPETKPFPQLLNRALNQISVSAKKQMEGAVQEAVELLGLDGDWQVDLINRQFVKKE